MKINKQELYQLIKEEIENLLLEQQKAIRVAPRPGQQPATQTRQSSQGSYRDGVLKGSAEANKSIQQLHKSLVSLGWGHPPRHGYIPAQWKEPKGGGKPAAYQKLVEVFNNLFVNKGYLNILLKGQTKYKRCKR